MTYRRRLIHQTKYNALYVNLPQRLLVFFFVYTNKRRCYWFTIMGNGIDYNCHNGTIGYYFLATLDLRKTTVLRTQFVSAELPA